jgi:hypothetical protein
MEEASAYGQKAEMEQRARYCAPITYEFINRVAAPIANKLLSAA